MKEHFPDTGYKIVRPCEEGAWDSLYINLEWYFMGKNALLEYNDKTFKREYDAVEAAVNHLLSVPEKVDFYSVAKASGVCRSTLYRNPFLRDMVCSARDSQPDPWKLVQKLQDENSRLRALGGDLVEVGPAPPERVEYAFVELAA